MTDPDPAVTDREPAAGSLRRAPVDVVRGALIGVAEVVPGVSGGTVALVVGIYEILIGSASCLVSAVKSLVTDVPRGRGTAAARGHLSRVTWRVVLPVGVGMLTAVIVAAAALEPVLEEQPVRSRALFAGLILASIAVPAGMVRTSARPRHVLMGVAGAVAAFVLTGLPPGEVSSPPLPVVALAASVAVCALVLPGVSGSFFLLTVGLYVPTLSAVNDRDLGYLAVFCLGAVAGLAAFVKVLEWLLEHRRTATLAVMAGLMAGSLRALWPWQTDERGLLAPQGDVPVVALLVALGVAVVLGLLLLQSRAARPPGDFTEVRRP